MDFLKQLDEYNPSDSITEKVNALDQTGVLLAPIERFHEDPDNPRKIFNEEALQELVKSLQSINSKTGEPRGILQPLSVCEHPTIKGDFQINGGSRRFRAAKIAGIKKLPYFIDNSADSEDKIIDNLIREGFELIEMAEYIKSKSDQGMKAGDIAESLGKKPNFVSDYLTYWSMSDSIKKLLENGFTSSIQVLSALHRASKNYPEEIESFCLSIDSKITYSKVIGFIDSLKSKEVEEPVITNEASEDDEGFEVGLEEDQQQVVEDQATQILNDDKEPVISKPIIIVEFEGNRAELLIKKKSKSGFGWIKNEFDGSEEEIVLDNLQLVSIEGK